MVGLVLILLQASPRLYFLNSPESVKREMRLCDIRFTGENRFFFHYKNSTGKVQHFYISTDKFVTGHCGINVNYSPGIAGSKAGYNFLALGCPINGLLNKDIVIPVNHTIDGIIEVKSGENNVFRMRLGNSDCVSGKYQISPNIIERSELVSSGVESFGFIIGEKRANLILGDYGTSFQYSITNILNIPVKLRLCVEALGGNIMLPFRIGDKMIMSPLIPWHSRAFVTDFSICGSQTVLVKTMPCGGWCMPFKITLTPVQILHGFF